MVQKMLHELNRYTNLQPEQFLGNNFYEHLNFICFACMGIMLVELCLVEGIR